jgi:hypothetical protein
MTATETKHRRGTSSQVAAMTPAQGEIVMDTTNDRIHIGNGSLAGGRIIPNVRDLINETFVTATVGGTANAITLTVTPALAAYANGVRIRFKATNTNTGATTVNVNSLGTRTVQKLSGTSLVALTGSEIVAGAWYELNDDGTVFQLGSGGGGGASGADRQIFTSSGTWTKPSGFPSTAMVLLEAWGGGGGGSSGGGGGGGGGSYKSRFVPLSSLGATETITIGAGGAADTNGGSTTIGSLLAAYGGSTRAVSSQQGGAAGGFLSAPITSRTNDTIGEGYGGLAASNGANGYFTGGGGGGGSTGAGNGGGSVYGGGGGGGNAGGASSVGGTSQFGGNGGAGNSNTGTAGTAPAGGGGCGFNISGGAGARGEARITVFG